MGRTIDGKRRPIPDEDATYRIDEADARDLPYHDNTANLVVTSPPYWQKRDYGHEDQIGQEDTPEEFINTFLHVVTELERVLHPSGSLFINIGNTYADRSLVNISGRLQKTLNDNGWVVRNDIIWAKAGGMPDPADTRLPNRHEHILHVTNTEDYYYDRFGYEQKYGDAPVAGDVWKVAFDRNTGDHTAPFPEELVSRILTLAAPPAVCAECGSPLERVTRRTTELDESRDQARRAMEIYEESDLTEEHVRAIQSVGISDAGKAREVQGSISENSKEVQRLAEEAKEVLGGYFREFTFANRETAGWDPTCDCDADTKPGVVLDPFVGTGTTAEAALKDGFTTFGADIDPPEIEQTRIATFQ